MSIVVVCFLAYPVFQVKRDAVSVHSKQMLYAGYLTLEYFFFIVAKDLLIMLSQLFYGGFMGFWHAIVLHTITLPIDIVVLLTLCIWGSTILNNEDALNCKNDESCKPFVTAMHFNVTFGYGYIIFSILVKPFLLSIFCFCFQGLRLRDQD